MNRNFSDGLLRKMCSLRLVAREGPNDIVLRLKNFLVVNYAGTRLPCFEELACRCFCHPMLCHRIVLQGDY